MYLWFVAVIVAYFIKGLCGFANTLVFTTILSFGEANANISPIDLLLGYPSNIILTFKNRKKLNPRVYIPLIMLVLTGSIPGAFMLKNVNIGVVKLIFGVVVIVLGIEMIVREYIKKKNPSSKLLLGFIGIMSGVLCGLFGIGALLAAYVGRVTNDSESFKANISAVFIADNTFRIILYSFLHIITLNTIKLSFILVFFGLIGLMAGIKCSKILNEKIVRRLTAVLLVLSGISLIIKNL